MDDYYQILEVSRSATAEEIKSSYRRLARLHHPDTNKGDKKAEEKFKEISAAYEVLKNAFTRNEYDRKIKNNRYNTSQSKTSATEEKPASSSKNAEGSRQQHKTTETPKNGNTNSSENNTNTSKAGTNEQKDYKSKEKTAQKAAEKPKNKSYPYNADDIKSNSFVTKIFTLLIGLFVSALFIVVGLGILSRNKDSEIVKNAIGFVENVKVSRIKENLDKVGETFYKIKEIINDEDEPIKLDIKLKKDLPMPELKLFDDDEIKNTFRKLEEDIINEQVEKIVKDIKQTKSEKETETDKKNEPVQNVIYKKGKTISSKEVLVSK